MPGFSCPGEPHVSCQEWSRFVNADAVLEVVDLVEGDHRFVVLEWACHADERDLIRLIRNARCLAGFTKKHIYLVIASQENDDNIQHLIDNKNIYGFEFRL